MKQSKILGLFTASLILFSSYFAQALSVKSLTLKQIVSFSDIVFRGELVESKLEDDVYESGYLVKYFTFNVEECLVGVCGEQITFKQIAMSKNGPPEYQTGKTYLLFLPKASDNTGLVAPVGIWQGRYELKNEQGRWVVPALSKKGAAIKSLGLVKASTTGVDSTVSYDAFKKEIQETIE